MKKHSPRILGVFQKNQKGFGFVVTDDKHKDDIYIDKNIAEGFFDGDRVEAFVDRMGNLIRLNLIEHRFKYLIGRFTPEFGKKTNHAQGWLIYETKRSKEEVFIPKAEKGIKPGDWIKAELFFGDKNHQRVTAKIIEVYGREIPAKKDPEVISALFQIFEEHSKEAVSEAKALTLQIDQDRTDLRALPFITIDGETARDFDDAIYVEATPSGFKLWVAIADVSHYVTSGSALDLEARQRGTSVYFPERALHMLPRELSENLCSLKPNEPRLTLVAEMGFDSSGSILTTDVYNAVIQSQHRMTYSQIQELFLQNNKKPAWLYKQHFELFALLQKKRSSRGSIDFEFSETEILVDDEGEPTKIINRDRYEAHKLIEEFMIIANEAVTSWIQQYSWPFLYRVHDDPSPSSLKKFYELAQHLGLTFKDVRTIPKEVKGHPAESLINMALLRSMKQAVYSSTHSGHFGLASNGYTHFTSPIRRYPDLVVHRLLKRVIAQKKLLGNERELLEADFIQIAEHCSYRERLSADAEREIKKIKCVRLMKNHLGSWFKGKVNGMTEKGLFVVLDDPAVEGFVSKESFGSVAYQFDEKKFQYHSKKSGLTIKIGDQIEVQVVRANMERREIDFVPGKKGPVAPKKKH